MEALTNPVDALPEPHARPSFDHGIQSGDHRGILLDDGNGRPVVRCSRQVDDPAGPLHRHPVLAHQDRRGLPARERRYNFRLSRSLIAAFSRARSLYIRFSFAFSDSSSFRRFRSGTVAPAYFFFQLK